MAGGRPQRSPRTEFQQRSDLFRAARLLKKLSNQTRTDPDYVYSLAAQLRSILLDRRKDSRALLFRFEEIAGNFPPVYSTWRDVSHPLLKDTVLSLSPLNLTLSPDGEGYPAFTLKRVLELPIMVVAGVTHSMESIIQDVANSLGGAHYSNLMSATQISAEENLHGLLRHYLCEIADVVVEGLLGIFRKYGEFTLFIRFLVSSDKLDERREGCLCTVHFDERSPVLVLSVVEAGQLRIHTRDRESGTLYMDLPMNIPANSWTCLAVSTEISNDLRFLFHVSGENASLDRMTSGEQIAFFPTADLKVHLGAPSKGFGGPRVPVMLHQAVGWGREIRNKEVEENGRDDWIKSVSEYVKSRCDEIDPDVFFFCDENDVCVRMKKDGTILN